MYQISYTFREILSEKSLVTDPFPNSIKDVVLSLQSGLATVVDWKLSLIEQ